MGWRFVESALGHVIVNDYASVKKPCHLHALSASISILSADSHWQHMLRQYQAHAFHMSFVVLVNSQ